jgi:hypothetical protein
MENWKDIDDEEEWASKASLVPLFFMNWEAPMPDVMVETLNTFIIKGTISTLGKKIKCMSLANN